MGSSVLKLQLSGYFGCRRFSVTVTKLPEKSTPPYAGISSPSHAKHLPESLGLNVSMTSKS